jgi:hypothetical protein
MSRYGVENMGRIDTIISTIDLQQLWYWKMPVCNLGVAEGAMCFVKHSAFQVADEVVAIAARLPNVEVRWQQPKIAPPTQQQRNDAEDGLPIETALAISVSLRRHIGSHSRSSTRVYAPRFPKVHLTIGR